MAAKALRKVPHRMLISFLVISLAFSFLPLLVARRNPDLLAERGKAPVGFLFTPGDCVTRGKS